MLTDRHSPASPSGLQPSGEPLHLQSDNPTAVKRPVNKESKTRSFHGRHRDTISPTITF